MDKLVEINLKKAFNYQLITTILQRLGKYSVFTCNMEDYEVLFQYGREGYSNRLIAGMDSDVQLLYRWSKINILHLEGVRPIKTKIYLKKKYLKDGLLPTDLPLLDNQVLCIKDIDELSEIWDDPLGLEPHINKLERSSSYQGDCLNKDSPIQGYDMNILIDALIFRLKQENRLDVVQGLEKNQLRILGRWNNSLRMFADILLTLTRTEPATGGTPTERLKKDFEILNYGKTLETLVCNLAKTLR